MERSTGEIIAIRGHVVYVRFAPAVPPCDRQLPTGTGNRVVLEVQTRPDTATARRITRTPARGMSVEATGTTPRLRQYSFVSVFRACAESQAGEHAGRLAAERNLDEVTRLFRRARITFGVPDVLSGYEAGTHAR